ncbi:MAG: hypothetical protein H2174_06305 [Vampirovibrio sp.]|jgi:hypothetical protein|nr:hypothetical protein [Vampirovibrio sp.]
MNTTVLVFLKSLATPIVLFTENPQQTYDELREILKSAHTNSPKLIEKQTIGPLKFVTFWDTQLAGFALQVDPSQPTPPMAKKTTLSPPKPTLQ